MLWAKLRKLDIRFPEIFPINSVRAMRGCFYAMQENNLPQYAEAIFRSYWQEGKNIGNLDILLDIANHSGFDPDKYKNFIESSCAKDLLIQNTDELIKRGGFGSPTFFYQNHMFLEMIGSLFLRNYSKKAILKNNP